MGRLLIKINCIRRQPQHFQRDTRKSPGKAATHCQLQLSGHSDLHKQLTREDGRRRLEYKADAAVLPTTMENTKKIAISDQITKQFRSKIR